MTAPTLPDTLRRLHTALQSGGGRIRVERRNTPGLGPSETLWVVLGGRVQRVALLSPERHADLNDPFHLLIVEAALREECEARGWDWATYRCGPTVRAVIYEVPGRDSSNVIDLDGEAATPAHALALALVEALAALEGGGA